MPPPPSQLLRRRKKLRLKTKKQKTKIIREISGADVVGLDGDRAVGFEGQQGLCPTHAGRIGVDGP
jgi:hypothetical protein